MQTIFCTRCGSQNHFTHDCNKPDQKLTPPPESLPDKTALQKHDATTSEAEVKRSAKEPPLLPATWPGGPLICSKTRLPVFETDKAVSEFKTRYAPNEKEYKRWTCDHCLKMHVKIASPSPSGGSSGTERESTLPKNFRPFLRASTRREMDERIETTRRSVATIELPSRPQAEQERAKVAPKKAVTKPKSVEGGLF